MSTAKSYPYVVVGAGSGGLVVAIGLAKAGKKVLLIEKGTYGGDCTNFGCIPSKTLIGLAKRKSRDLAFVQKIVHEVRSHEEPAALQKLGVNTLTGVASFLSPHLLQVYSHRAETWNLDCAKDPGLDDRKSVNIRNMDRLAIVQPRELSHQSKSKFQPDGSIKEVSGEITQIEAGKIVLATGSFPEIPPIPGLKDTPFLTNETIFDLAQPPKSLVVIGGGPIGCELAQAFQRLGASVSLIHSHAQLLGREPKAASDILIEQFKKEGMSLYLNSKVESVSHSGSSFQVKMGSKVIEAEKLLVASGRRAQLEHLHLDKAEVAFTEHGISIDAYGRTSQKHIFAIGDASGPPFFTHLAENRARASLTTLLFSPFFKKRISKQAIPRVTYTDPEIASIGLSEEEAIQKYGQKAVAVYLVPMSEVDRAITQDRTEGFVKLITKRWSSQILGGTIVAPCAGEMLSEISLAMFAKIPLRKLADLIHPYPTYSLAIRRAADRWLTQTLLGALWKK